MNITVYLFKRCVDGVFLPTGVGSVVSIVIPELGEVREEEGGGGRRGGGIGGGERDGRGGE